MNPARLSGSRRRPRPGLTVREPGALLGAVAARLGFHPADSLVLVGLRGNQVGLTLRVDLPPPEHTGIVCAAAVDSLTAGAPTGAVVVVVGGPAPPPAECGVGGAAAAPPPREDVARTVTTALDAHGVRVRAVLWAAGTTAGSPWACYPPCGCGGVVPDPSTTPVAAAAVAAGHVVRPCREALSEELAPADPVALRRRGRLLDRVLREPPDPGRGSAVDAALTATARGRLVVDDELVVAVVAALGEPSVRDAALQACVGPGAWCAEQLWTALVRETPDPEAAEPAVLLAVCALARGDGAMANVALDRARRSWPGHALATSLGSAVAAGFGPDQVRTWLDDLAPAWGAADGGPWTEPA